MKLHNIKLRPLSPRQSRVLALAILVVMVALLVLVLGGPVFWAHHHYNSAIEQQTDLLARYQRIGAMRPDLVKQIDAVNAKVARKSFLKNTVPALAASEMQEIAKGVIESNGGKISSIQIPEHKDDGLYRKITVNVQMSGSIGVIQKIFYLFETQQPYFFLDNVSVRPLAGRMFRVVPVPGAEPEYVVQFDLYAYSILETK